MDELKRLQGISDRDWLLRLVDPMAEIRQQMQAAYIDPMREARERMREASDLQEAVEQMRAATAIPQAMQAWIDQERKHRDAIAKALDWRADWERHFREIANPLQGLRQQAKDYMEALDIGPGSQWAKMLEEVRRRFEELPAETRVQVAMLIERGWCLDPEMTSVGLQELVAALQAGEESEVQASLVEYFGARADDIEATLRERHPQRAAVLEDAFKAHREGRYALSVPVFLAQGDGITFDRMERQLYSRKRSKGVSGYVDGLPEDDLVTAYWSVFTIEADAPLTRDTRALPPGFDGLNRHAVLHGTDPNYGTEVNSLRAVSVLNLASYLLSEVETQNQ